MTVVGVHDHHILPMVLGACILASGACGGAVECGETEPEKFAAEELTRWLGEISEQPVEESFRLGTEGLSLFPEDKAALAGTDGFAVRRKDGAIYIVSPQPRGVLYGVYAFLERNSDIIWARPDETCGTIYTRTKTFGIREADFRSVPKFQMRGWWFCGPAHHEASERWHARVRCNFGCANQRHPDVLKRAIESGSYIGGACGHNLSQYIPDALYDAHPEYFAEIGGVRRRDAEKTQFCFSNMKGAEVVGETAVAKIAKRLEEFRASNGISFDHWALKQGDNQRLCECPACQADIPLGDGRVSRKTDENFRSNQTFLYLNRALEVIGRTYPDMRVDTFAYQFTAPPPDVKVHEKFNVAFCPFIKNDRVPVTDPINAKWKARAEKWSKATKNIMWREYWGCASGYPRQHSFVAAKDLRWINEALGFTRVYSETMPDLAGARGAKNRDYRRRWDASAMEHWVLSRLMWDPTVPVEQYREEYVTRTYRKAAAPMRTFYALLAKSWFSDTKASCYTDDMYGNAARYIVQFGIAEQLLTLLDEAIALAADDVPAVRTLLARQKAHFADLIAHAQPSEAPVSVPCVTDGDWSKAKVFDGFLKVKRQITNESVPAEDPTRVLVMHDRKNLRVRFICEGQDGAKLESQVPRAGSETFPGGDHVELALELNRGDHSYHCGVNFRNERADMMDGKMDFDAKWTSDVKRTPTGYEVELSFDLESLGFELTKYNRCGLCLARMTISGNARGKRFSSWRGAHPKSGSVFGSVVLEQE